MIVVCYLLFVHRCFLCVVGCQLFVDGLFVACCLMFTIVCCVSVAVCGCLLFVSCCVACHVV